MKHIITPTAPFSYVADDLAVGGILAYADLDFGRFDLALQCAYELAGKPVDKHRGVIVHNFRLDDTKDERAHAGQLLEVHRAVGLLTQARRQGLRVLVTCAQGRNRSAMVAAEYLIQSGNRADDVIRKIQERRANSLTNPTFVAWLKRPR